MKLQRLGRMMRLSVGCRYVAVAAFLPSAPSAGRAGHPRTSLVLAQNRGEEIKISEVVYEEEGEGAQLHGLLVHKEERSDQRSPGIIIAHTAVGPRDLYLLWRAASLVASEGYVCLVADLFSDASGAAWDPAVGGEKMATVRANRGLLASRMAAAHRQLQHQPGVDAERCAAIGYCLGGQAVLDYARSGAAIRSVISFHGILDALPPQSLCHSGTVVARILICHGHRDPLVGAEERAACLAQLDELNASWNMLVCGGAVHGFTCPAQALNDREGFGYHPRADVQSWRACLEELAASFK